MRTDWKKIRYVEKEINETRKKTIVEICWGFYTW